VIANDVIEPTRAISNNAIARRACDQGGWTQDANRDWTNYSHPARRKILIRALNNQQQQIITNKTRYFGSPTATTIWHVSHQTNTCHAILDDQKTPVAVMTSPAPHLITMRFRLLGLALLMLAGLLFADEQ
jgi:hypothetical protein